MRYYVRNKMQCYKITHVCISRLLQNYCARRYCVKKWLKMLIYSV